MECKKIILVDVYNFKDFIIFLDIKMYFKINVKFFVFGVFLFFFNIEILVWKVLNE